MGWNIENSPEVGYWVAEQLGRGYFAERCQAIGLRKDGVIVAGAIYENYNGRSIMAHIAFQGRLTPSFIAAIFDYAYNVCGVEKVISVIEDTNTKSIHVCENMGFSEEARIRDSHLGGDQIIYTLKKADCRFIRGRYVEKLSHTSARA